MAAREWLRQLLRQPHQPLDASQHAPPPELEGQEAIPGAESRQPSRGKAHLSMAPIASIPKIGLRSEPLTPPFRLDSPPRSQPDAPENDAAAAPIDFEPAGRSPGRPRSSTAGCRTAGTHSGSPPRRTLDFGTSSGLTRGFEGVRPRFG